jgi:hypothetical protein
VIVYRDAGRVEAVRPRLDRLRRLAEAGDAAAFLVEAGELEQALLDAANPRGDHWGTLEQRLRTLLLAAGRAFVAAARGSAAPAPPLAAARAALARVEAGPLPTRVLVRPPEGYVHYALDPAGYAAAAAAYARAAGAARAARAIVIGIRSIGTSLSAVVAAALGAPAGVSIRPRGPVGSRRIIATPALEARLTRWLGRGGDVLLVDEGPGATGETLAAAAAWLATLGVGAERLVVLPSRPYGMPLAPADRRAWFGATRKFAPPPDDARIERVAGRIGLDDVVDLSAGAWRARIPGAAGLPACPVHERRKYLGCDSRGRRHVFRYAGLGAWGDAVAARAARLADAGAGPDPTGAADGFVALPWAEGSPAAPAAAADPAFRRAVARYLAARDRALRTGMAARVEPIAEMLECNAREALGGRDAGLAAAVRRLERLPAREAVIPDARLDLHEWVATATGYVKVDALDHGDGLRLPGPADPAWDLAGAAIELALDPGAAAELAARHAAATGASARETAEALAAYRAPYAAWRLADALLSIEEAEGEDRDLFRRQARRYRDALRAALRSAA